MVLTRVSLPSPVPAPRRRVLLLHNGGTLGGSFTVPEILGEANALQVGLDEHLQSGPSDQHGLNGQNGQNGQTEHGFSEELHRFCPEIFGIADVTVHVLFEDDSSNLGLPQWRRLVDHLVAHWDAFDAFLVVHGTDTLAYLASFLSFALADLTKPIVITGSQRPLRELRSDARMNLIDSVQMASLGYAGIFVCFNSDVFLGSRVSKLSNLELGAFQSPNLPKLGHFGVEVSLNRYLMAQLGIAEMRDEGSNKGKGALPRVDTRANENLITLSVMPGARLPASVRKVLCEEYDGIVIEGFGLGHAPTQHPDWLLLAQEAQRQGVAVLMTSQCRSGRVELGLYPIGRAFQAFGVLSGLDMTRECATMKLMVMLGREVPRAQWQEFMARPLNGEVTVPAEFLAAGVPQA